MRGAGLAAALVLAAGLAGCLGTGSAPEPLAPGVAPQAGPLRLDLAPCEEQFAFLPVAMADAAARVPPDFVPLALDPAGQVAVMVGVGFRCQRAIVDGGRDLGPVQALGFVLAVEPPEAYRSEGTQYYVIPLGGITDNAALAEVVGGWHFPAIRVGEVDFALDPTTEAARLGQVAASAEGATATFTTQVAGVVEPQEPDRFRVFGLRDGAVVGAIDWAWPEGGSALEEGTATLEASASLGLPLQVQPGLGKHYWGDYRYEIAYTEFA